MKKFILLSLLVTLGFVACNKESDVEKNIAQVEIPFELIRFDQAFLKTTPATFAQLKANFPYLFNAQTSDSVWLKKKKDPLFIEVEKEVQQKFAQTTALEKELKSLFQHIKYYFPEQHPGKVITLISDMDVMHRVIYADTLTLIALDTYLGEDHRFYDGFDAYTLKEFNANKIPSDVAERFLEQKIVPSQERTFLSHMIDAGKMLYGKDILLPHTADALKIGYSNEQTQWCEKNETQIWKYFIENKLLYDTDPKLYSRFIQNAPFSKFYLELDTESPGKTGAWIGWQIVRSYMNQNQISYQELIMKSPEEIFNNSKYKPKK